jgi:surface carbohydrate biosynthesis protein
MSQKREKIPVLWLVEHIAREMDVACAVKALAESRFDLQVTVRNMYYHANEVLQRYEPAVVVHPFFYFVSGALATEDYVEAWPHTTHFNLAWEQIHYKAHMKIKAPSDEFTREKVIHHAWGKFYKDYLMEYGVPSEQIFVNGHPAYQLFRSPYNRYYKQRDWLADKYGLDLDARWIFVPENYRWAFIGDKVKLFTKLGGDENEITELRDFCIDSLRILLNWCNNTAGHDKIAIIFRTRPSINSRIIRRFFEEHVGHAAPNLYFIKEESVREWIMASDMTISSYSTSLIEAAIADKPIYMVEPIPIPDSLYCDWYRFTPRLHTMEDFETRCLSSTDSFDANSLKTWAESEMLARGDPIQRLVEFVKYLVDSRHEAKNAVRERTFECSPGKDYFNKSTHEHDVFAEEDVQSRVKAWQQILEEHSIVERETISPQQPHLPFMTERAKYPTNQIINRSMSREDLLTEDANHLIQDLNSLIENLYSKKLYMSSWVGTLPSALLTKKANLEFNQRILHKFKSQAENYLPDPAEADALARGMEQRLGYQPLPGAVDDLRFPWFLYWEIYWVLKVTMPFLHKGARLLDGGGTSSLFTCYMASLGFEVHSVDLNEKLRANGVRIAKDMNWNLNSYAMDLQKLEFPDTFFDHAFSICVFEHLDYNIKQGALAEIARCLKPGGILSITFDYRNPAPGVVGYGKDTRPRNQLKTQDDIRRSFLSTGHFELMGNQEFLDNGESYLVHHRFANTPYTFGAIFLRKKELSVVSKISTVAQTEMPNLSVIVCTYNRSELLDGCLASLVSQEVDSHLYEIIVVDNNSKDDTFALVSKYISNHENIRYVIESRQGLSHARNTGSNEARGSYLAYIDDDAVVPQGYLSSLLKVINKQMPDIIGGPIYPYYTTRKPSWFKDTYETRKFATSNGFSTTCRISGGNFIIRKSILEQIGMFDPNFGMVGDKIRLGEERVLLEEYRKKVPLENQRVYYSLDCYINHYVSPQKMTIRYMIKRYYVVGRTASRIKQKEPHTAIKRIKQYIPNQFSYIYDEIRTKGLERADYVGILFNMVLRLGNIVELFSHGLGPVFKPWLKVKYQRFRMWCKKRAATKRFLIWFEVKTGIHEKIKQ